MVDCALEILSDFLFGCQDVGIIFRQFVIQDQALTFGSWGFGQCLFEVLNVFLGNNHRMQIGIWKITIVIGCFFGAHGFCCPRNCIEISCFLVDGVALVDACDLSFDFVLNGLMQKFQRIHVLDFNACAQRLSGATHRDIGVNAQLPLFHISVTHSKRPHQGSEAFDIVHHFICR